MRRGGMIVLGLVLALVVSALASVAAAGECGGTIPCGSPTIAPSPKG